VRNLGAEFEETVRRKDLHYDERGGLGSRWRLRGRVAAALQRENRQSREGGGKTRSKGGETTAQSKPFGRTRKGVFFVKKRGSTLDV